MRERACVLFTPYQCTVKLTSSPQLLLDLPPLCLPPRCRYFSLCRAVHGLDLATLQSMREQESVSDAAPHKGDGRDAAGNDSRSMDAAANGDTETGVEKGVQDDQRGQEDQDEAHSNKL